MTLLFGSKRNLLKNYEIKTDKWINQNKHEMGCSQIMSVKKIAFLYQIVS